MSDHSVGYKYFLGEFKEWVERRYSILFILGSGASVSSGIPSGGTLARKWLRKLHQRDFSDIASFPDFIEHISKQEGSFKGVSERTIAEFYPAIYKSLFKEHPQQGYDEIQSLIEKGRPSLGYTIIAHLLSQRQVSDVLTTNFDNLSERAIARFTNSFPRVVGHELLIEHIESLPAVPTIIKVHRDAYFSPASIEDEIRALKEQWSPALKKTLPKYIPVVIGYGGNDEGLINVLGEMTRNDFGRGLYWLTYEQEEVNQKVYATVTHLAGSFVQTKGFDRTLLDLALEIGLDDKIVRGSIKGHFHQIQDELESQLVKLAEQPSEPVIVTSPEGTSIEETRDMDLLQDLDRFSDNPKLSLASALSFNEANQRFQALSEPDVLAYNIWMNKAEDYGQARRILAEMEKVGLRPDVVTYSTLLKKSPDYEAARRVMAEMRQVGVIPNAYTFNTLLKKTVNYTDARRVFDEMRQTGIEPDVYTYSTLINKASYAEARGLLTEMMELGVEPNAFTYNLLISKARNTEEARALLEEARRVGVVPDKHSYSLLVNSARDVHEARKILREILESKIEIGSYTYQMLLSKATSFDEARNVLNEMIGEGVSPTPAMFNVLMGKSRTQEQAEAVLELMRAQGVNPDLSTYNMLIGKVGGLELAEAVLRQMKNSGLRPNVETYRAILALALNYPDGRAVFWNMRDDGVEPNTDVLETLLGKVESLQEFMDFYALLGESYVPMHQMMDKLEAVASAATRDSKLLLSLFDSNPRKIELVIRLFSPDAILDLTESRTEQIVGARIHLDRLLVPCIRMDKLRKNKLRLEHMINQVHSPNQRQRCQAYWLLHYGEYESAFDKFQALAANERNPKFLSNYETRSAESLLLAGRYSDGFRHALRARVIERSDNSDQVVLIVACFLMAHATVPIAEAVLQLRVNYGIEAGKRRLTAVLELLNDLPGPRGAQLHEYMGAH